MKFNIVTLDKKKVIIKFLFFFSGFLIYPYALIINKYFFIIDEQEPFIGFITLGIPFISWIFGVFYQNFFLKRSKIIGFFNVFENKFDINSRIINFEDIKFIKIKYDGFFGKSKGANFSINQGDKNEITIVLKNKDVIIFFVFLENKNDFYKLKQLIDFLNDNEVKVIVTK